MEEEGDAILNSNQSMIDIIKNAIPTLLKDFVYMLYSTLLPF